MKDAAHLLSVSQATYKMWEDGVVIRCTDNNHRKIRFFLEGLLDPIAKRSRFPLSTDDCMLISKMFAHRALLELASPESLAIYKAELAAIAVKTI